MEIKKIHRTLSLTSAISISIAGMIGAGIFVLPGLAASQTGPSIWLAYLCAGICILPAALSKSELATSMPKNGGTYVYIERAFGPLFGTISGIGLWLSLLLKSSFALVGFSAYLSVLINIGFQIEYISLSFLVLIMILNIAGIKKVAKVQISVVTLSLIGLTSILILGIPEIDNNLLSPLFPKGSVGFVSTIALVYISYAGVTKVAAIAGEIKNPSKNIPRAMITSLILITILYVLITLTLIGNIPLEELKTDIKPIYSLANIIGGKYFGYGACILGIITLISMANSGVLTSSRFPFAMARDNLVPSLMGTIHKKYVTPIISITITCLVMGLVIIFLDVEKIAKMASAFKVMMFISVNACVIVFRETSAQWYKPTYSAPFYPYLQLFGIISGIILICFLGLLPILGIIATSLLGTFVYLFYGRKTNRSGILQRYAERTIHFILHGKKPNYDELKTVLEEKRDTNLEDYLISNAGVVVPLLGNESSAEMLIDIGSSINKKEILQTVKINEVPNQTTLDAIKSNNPKNESLKRKISLLEKEKNVIINFENIVTHNITDTIQGLSDQSNCDWLVLGWNGRAHNGILVNNPIGWLVTNVNSNFALFKDNGDRRINRILLALRPGKKINKDYIKTVNKISKYYKGSFTLLHVLSNNESEREESLIRKDALQLLKENSENSNFILERSKDPIDMVSDIAAGYDLLVLGTPRKENVISMLFGSGKNDFVETSPCSVLRLTIKK